MSTTINVPNGSESHGDNPNPNRTTSLGQAEKAGRKEAVKPFAPIWQAVKILGSLRITVFLFSLSMVLVFFGTLAQIDKSNWTVVEEYFRDWFVWIPFQLILEFAKKFSFGLVPETVVWSGSFPFFAGWTLGTAMLINLFAAHLTRFKLSWRRSGIITLHLGVILLMGGELITGIYAVESRMMLQVGESKNFIDDSRKIELAFTDEGTHETITIPQAMLVRGKTITSPDLPVDVEVLERLKNTTHQGVTGGDDSDTIISTSGGRYRVIPASEGSGVKADQSEDIPGVEVRLLKKGTAEEVQPKRIYSLWEYENGPASRLMALPSRVTVAGRTYTVGLRNKRIYKPYTVTLLKFEHTKHAGTNTHKDFASTIRLQDPAIGEDREVRIWMNHPLRHEGETFYQQSTLGSETATGEMKDTGTVLQVVKNPGWILPYISCCVVTLGMLIHFGMGIVGFTSKNAAKLMRAAKTGNSPDTTTESPTDGNLLKKFFPWVIVGVCALYAVMLLFPRPEKYKDFDLSAFGAIPVLDDGRVKPLDSLARTTMLYISGRTEFEDANGKTQPAILWLLETMAADDPSQSKAEEFPVFRIDNEQLIQLLELKEKPGSYRYSVKELRPHLDKFFKALNTAKNLEANKRDLFHTKVIELASKLSEYNKLAHRATPTLIPMEKGSDKWLALDEIEEEVGRNPKFIEEAQSIAQDEVMAEWEPKIKQLGKLTQSQQVEVQQAIHADIKNRTDVELHKLAARELKTVSPAAGAFGDILAAYKADRPKAFSEAIHTYTSEYAYPLHPEFADTVRFEQKMNQANPLIVAAFLFIFAAIFRIIGWLVWEKPMMQTAWGLASISLVLMVATLLGRMYIMQRPLVFVTNLYSSALMIGTGILTAGLIVERVYKNGLGLIVGCLAAASLVDIAHHLSTDGKDTMGALVAVLDTNYWLASHVTTVTLGYAATVFAGMLGVCYILWGLIFSNLTKEKHTIVGSMIYGVLCFAMLLSFVGTVLGGIWADQSWGRFWGWDPKENGAVLIVIWNALILHARWCGLVRQRGMAVLSVVGIMVTFWSYFGTNQLGAGLHDYGFNKSLADLCSYIWIGCFGIIGLGLIPLKYWRSFAGTGLPRAETAIPLIATSGLGGSRANERARSKKAGKDNW